MVSCALSRVPDAKRGKQTWSYIDLVMVLGLGAAVIVVFYSGFFLNWNGVKGLYQAFKAWTETGAAGHAPARFRNLTADQLISRRDTNVRKLMLVRFDYDHG